MRPPNIIRPMRLHTTLPEDIRAKLDLHLYSPLEGRIPKGAYQAFFIERIQEFFNTRTLDLNQYIQLPTEAIVRGSEASINILHRVLKDPQNEPHQP